jgi:hypothetical protein
MPYDHIDEEDFIRAYHNLSVKFEIGKFDVKDLNDLIGKEIFKEILDDLEVSLEYSFHPAERVWESEGYIYERLASVRMESDIYEETHSRSERYKFGILDIVEDNYPCFECFYDSEDLFVSTYFYYYPEEYKIAEILFGRLINMRNERIIDSDINPHWREKLSRLISLGQKQAALKTLDKFVESVLPLFRTTPELQEERRIAWQLRIELLRKWDRKIEALAWVCLECELHPENRTAYILKERLKFELNLLTEDESNSLFPSSNSNNSTDWTGIAGMQELKSILEIDVIGPIRNPVVYEQFGVSIPNGILFYGPKGCGKTYVARNIANKINYNFIEVNPSDSASIYIHGTQIKINKVFREAEQKAPCVLFFDEFDAFAPNRSDEFLNHSYRSEVNELLTELNECSKKKILFIAASNNPQLIDPAALRPGRIDKKIFISLPDFEARVELFKLYMIDKPQNKIDWIRLGEYTDLYTHAEIKGIIESTARLCASKVMNISTAVLIDKIIDNPPEHTKEEVENMRNWRVG